MSCPFVGEEDHRDTPDVDDQIDFTQTSQEKPVETGGPTGRMPQVGVREPRGARPRPLLAASLAFPWPASREWPLDVASDPGGEPKVTESGTPPEIVRGVMKAAETAVGDAAAAEVSDADQKFLRANAISDKGETGSIQRQMAEEAAAEAFAPVEASQVSVLRRLLERPPPGLVAIPLVHRAFQMLRKVKAFTPGRVGVAGRADPVRAASTFRTGFEPHKTAEPGTMRTRAPRSPGMGSRAVGGVPMQFNAAERMRLMVGVSRRKVSEM